MTMRPVPNESKIPVGTVLLGKYRTIREIGRGGMAAVYEAEQIALGKKVAVKVLAAELSNSNIVIERFFREARAAAAVRSPYIVDVYDSGRLEDGRPFIAMEFLDGESLYDRMARIRIIDPQTTVRIITQCAKGLLKAHKAGIVHRDLKPENIFITKSEDGDEVAKLLDFGLAKFYAPVKEDEKSARLTREGAVFGTPAYMSPEQVKGQGNVDHRADLWALGCMAFECLIGRPVWNTDQGVAMTFAAIATAQIPIPSKIRTDLPREFDEWFLKALERDPNKRFQNAKELAEALQLAFGGTPANVSMINVSEIEEIEAQLDAIDGPTDESGLNPIPLVSSPVPTPPPSQSMVTHPSETSNPKEIGLAPTETPPALTPSGNELAPTAAPASRRTEKPSVLRYIVSSVALIGSVGVAFWVYSKMLAPQVFTPLVQSISKATPQTTTSSTAPVAGPELPKWAAVLADGQKAFSSGDVPGANAKFKEAQDQGAPAALVKSFLDQTKIGSTATGPCKMVAYGHPRLPGTTNADRPSIAAGMRGTIVTWTDDHEQQGHDHAYSVMLDADGHATSSPRDLTPEASQILRASLLPVNERTILLYSDNQGRESGVRVRWLDADGRIAGSSTLVGAQRSGRYWPAMDRTPDGYVVVWQDDRDKEGDDLFARRLGPELDPTTPELRLTDYHGPLGHGPNVRVPTVAVASNAFVVAYKLERDNQNLIMRMRVPLDDPSLKTGLPDEKLGIKPKDREIGDVQLVNEDKTAGDAPAVGCGTEGCFLAWNNILGGASAALIDPAHGKVIWRKKFTPTGARPTIGVGVDGAVYVAYFEKGLVKIAPLTRDGLGPVSVLGKVTGEQPRPALAGARTAGEWLVAWQDTEGNHTEVHVARAVCR